MTQARTLLRPESETAGPLPAVFYARHLLTIRSWCFNGAALLKARRHPDGHLDLLSHAILQPREHFEPRDGGIFLNAEGRRKFYLAYERRLEREFTSEQRGHRTTLRGELLHQIHSLKRTLATGDAFEPFLMN